MPLNFDSLVPNEYIIYVKDGYIQLHTNGVKNLEYATTLWTELIDVCKANRIYKILGIALTSSPITEEEARGLLNLSKELGMDNKFKLAWVELNPEFYDIVLFTEYLLSSNGMNIRSFYKVDQARAWLLSDSPI